MPSGVWEMTFGIQATLGGGRGGNAIAQIRRLLSGGYPAGTHTTMTTDFVGLDHVQVCCPRGGEDQARAFYGEVMGLVEVAKPEVMRARGGCWFQLGAGQGLHVGVLDPFAPATKAHPAIRVRDLATLERLVERIGSAGIEVEWADPPIADARCKLRDPFGNLIELLVGTTG